MMEVFNTSTESARPPARLGNVLSDHDSVRRLRSGRRRDPAAPPATGWAMGGGAGGGLLASSRGAWSRAAGPVHEAGLVSGRGSP